MAASSNNSHGVASSPSAFFRTLFSATFLRLGCGAANRKRLGLAVGWLLRATWIQRTSRARFIMVTLRGVRLRGGKYSPSLDDISSLLIGPFHNKPVSSREIRASRAVLYLTTHIAIKYNISSRCSINPSIRRRFAPSRRRLREIEKLESRTYFPLGSS